MTQFSLNNVHKRGLKHHHFISLRYGSQKPTSAARTEVHPMICQSTNKPGWVRGMPAPAAPSPLDRTAHLLYMLVTSRAFPLDYLSGKLSKPVLLSYIRLIYNSYLRVVVYHTQDFVLILEQHNNSLWQTLQNNSNSSLFSHRTNSKVLLFPCIHYRIDFTSTSVVIYNIYFSVGISYNIDFLVLLMRPLSVESKLELTSWQIDRLGRPSGAWSSRHDITPATEQATHCGWSTNDP